MFGARSIWLILLGAALVSRLVAALWLPNAEQDGYSYAEIITRWSNALSAGHFRVTDLFGFWLPLFPLAAALPNIWIGHSLLVGKILSALCGAASCLLVFAITRTLTGSVVLAFLSFAIVVSNPLHILYSAACMTDVPGGCFILASLCFVLQKRWTVAAILAALAASIRLEGWVLVVVIPFVQLIYERRISILALFILFVPVIAWLSVSQLATDDPLAFFVKRGRYQETYMQFYPTRQGFTFNDVRRDLEYFCLGANRGILLGAIAAGVLSISQAVNGHKGLRLCLGATLAYAFALTGLVLVGYLIKRQPVLFPRYGLILFTVGLPLSMWLLQYSFQPSQRSWIPQLISVMAIAICFWEAKRQLPTISKVIADYRAHRQIAETLAAAFQKGSIPNERCFSDDAAVRVLSQLPADRFVRSESAPFSAWQSVGNFESYLRKNQADYLVFTNIENSLPAKFYPNLGRQGQVTSDMWDLVAYAPSPFAPDVWLFRLRQSIGP
jgi:hypothetical protein